uniref:Uncharacterized protein n=1 Tax=Rousettus aegyptiacus TaxID=9407 RepID=A0A7J8F0P6_ROUAE|nr:hypothetical protein HJG63_012376 [Rousettus aegyptiacus]
MEKSAGRWGCWLRAPRPSLTFPESPARAPLHGAPADARVVGAGAASGAGRAWGSRPRGSARGSRSCQGLLTGQTAATANPAGRLGPGPRSWDLGAPQRFPKDQSRAGGWPGGWGTGGRSGQEAPA